MIGIHRPRGSSTETSSRRSDVRVGLVRTQCAGAPLRSMCEIPSERLSPFSGIGVILEAFQAFSVRIGVADRYSSAGLNAAKNHIL